jgi:hypothetical protein
MALLPEKPAFLLAFFLTVFPACQAPREELPVYSRDIARIGEHAVKEDLLRFRFRLELSNFPKEYVERHRKEPLTDLNPLKPLLDSALNKIVEDYAILAYGEKHGLVIPDGELKERFEAKQNALGPKTLESTLQAGDIPYTRWKRLTEDQIRVQYVLEKSLSDRLKITAGEVQSYYNRNRDEFKIQASVRVRHIVTDTKEKAEDILKRAKAGENFAQLAVNHSISPDRAKGGDLGYYAKGTMPAAFDTAFNLAKGQFSPIVKSEYGFHIFKLIDKRAPGVKTLAEVAPVIQQKIFEQKLKSQYKVWIVKVRKEIPVAIDGESLKGFVL